jgi:hypothetical protein
MTDFDEIADPPAPKLLLTAAQLQIGPPVDPLTRVLVYTADEWETFINEWVFSLKKKYSKVLRFTGAGDKGIDIAAFTDDQLLSGIWDNYQCKHYGGPIAPHVAWPEIGKILWHSFNQHYVPPRAHYFVAPKETSTSLTLLLANSTKLKAQLLSAWDKSVRDKIGVVPVPLAGEFAKYVDAFDFSIFKPMALREVVEGHRKTPYFVSRFGGGLPPRPKPSSPPVEVEQCEMRYVAHLLDAYADHKKITSVTIPELKKWNPLRDHFKRSREAFYHAESLRVFVRDKVEPGTFESLQEEVYLGVIDTHNGEHADGYERVVSVTNVAQTLALDAHPLAASTFPSDRRGMCHQLANEDRLKWTSN